MKYLSMDQKLDREKQFFKQLGYYPLRYALPLSIYNASQEESNLNSGTMTLLNGEKEIIGITCFHILKEYWIRARHAKNLTFQLGSLLLQPDSYLIDHSRELDLATFRFPKNFAKCMRLPSTPEIGELQINSISNADIKADDDYVLIGGFPGSWRRQVTEQKVLFHTCTLGPCKINAVHPDKIVCVMENLNEWKRPFDTLNSPLIDVGGFSGGPVFLIKEKSILIPDFLGIVYEGNILHGTDTLILYIRPAKFIQMDGTIKMKSFNRK